MEQFSVPIKTLIFDPANARKHSPKNLDAIKGSLARFGQQKPIVISKDDVVIAGNGTLEAAKSLGWENIQVVRSKLTGSDITAYSIADNRTGELAEWDLNVLPGTLEALGQELDLGEIGFDKDDLSKLLFTKQEIKEGLTGDDKIPEEVETRCKLGDLWILGEHRLLCGDSTDILQIQKLMGGDKADMVFTDPPYGKKFDVIENDDTILTEWISSIPIVSEGWVFVWTSWKVLDVWIKETSRIGKMTNLIIWDKGEGGIGDLTGTFSSDYEIALVFNRGSKLVGKRIGSVWSVGKDKSIDYLHPTQKPVELAILAFDSCTKNKSRILDFFLGSGSTLIACEKTGRKCYGMEIDPHYCDVIITRWEKFTGKTAQLSAENSHGMG